MRVEPCGIEMVVTDSSGDHIAHTAALQQSGAGVSPCPGDERVDIADISGGNISTFQIDGLKAERLGDAFDIGNLIVDYYFHTLLRLPRSGCGG